MKEKVKEPVTIRFKKLKNGSSSIYLDVYVNGIRTYKFLKMYLIPEKNKQDKLINKSTMEAANNIKAQLIIDINNRRAGILSERDTLLYEYCDHCYNEKNGGIKDHLYNAIHKLKLYCPNIRLVDVDRKYLNLYVTSLRKDGLSGTTVRHYYNSIAYVFNRAVEDEIITETPFRRMKRKDIPQMDVKDREYLSIDEFKLLYNSKPNGSIERMFLFSCLTGLRMCDAMSLKWDEIQEGRIVKVAQKTGKPINIKLSRLAIPLMEKNDTEYVFDRYCKASVSAHIKSWMNSIGINKEITYHCSRHTFATMELTMGADLYTTCKLLGHSSVQVTQIYAKIVDKKKDDAIDALDSII